MSYLYNFKQNQDILNKYPFMKDMLTSFDCNPTNGWKFVEFKPFYNEELSKEFLGEDSLKKKFRLLKVKLIKHDTQVSEDLKKKYCKVLDSDMFTLNLKDSEIKEGYRYLKIYVPNHKVSSGWLTESEKEDGWKVVSQKKRYFNENNRKRKLRKRANKESKKEDVKEEKEEVSFTIESL